MNVSFSERKVNKHQQFKQTVELPDLLYLQFESFDKLFKFGECSKHKDKELLYKILKIHFPIKNINGNIILDVIDYTIDPPKYTPEECIELGINYAVELTVNFRIVFYDKADILEQKVYFGEIPYMTPSGSFIYNGIERVCVTQIQKTTGVSFVNTNKKHDISDYVCKIIPQKGNWIEISIGQKKCLYICFNKKIKVLLSDFLKIIGFESEKELYGILNLVSEIKCNKTDLKKVFGKRIATKGILSNVGDIISEDNIEKILNSGLESILVFNEDDIYSKKREYFINTIANVSDQSIEDLALDLYKQFNTTYNGSDKSMALKYIRGIIFDEKLYNLDVVGRKKINSIVGCVKEDESKMVLTKDDFINIINHFFKILNGEKQVEDIDHYGNKCLWTIVKQLYDQLYISFLRISKIAKERLNICDKNNVNIHNLINNGVFSSIINQFFATNPFMQFMDELNPLAEVMHKRRISTIGVGGITADGKSTDIRDIHYSQYGKVCPVETPEGQNIGLISALSSYAKCDEYGVIITPYRKVKDGVIDLNDDHIVYLNANEDIYKNIAPANTAHDSKGKIIDEFVDVRTFDTFKRIKREEIDYIDISPNQAFSIGTSLIPFLENDDSSRALMGTNMQRQAVPLIRPQAPIVGTGLEKKICEDSRNILFAEHDGVIKYVDSQKIIVDYNLDEEEILCSYDDEKIKEYNLLKFKKTNQKTCINHRPIVHMGQKVKKGQPLVSGFATDNGELALGINLKVAFMTYQGYNYEDAIVISDKVVKNDLFTSIFLEEYETSTQKTRLCDEEFTKDLQEKNDHDDVNLDDDGLVKEGAFVEAGDVLVGKVKPKTTSNITPETKLLKEIFNERAYDMADDSLVMPPFSQGVVIKSKIYTRQNLSKMALKKINKEISDLKDEYIAKIDSFIELAVKKFTKLLDKKKSLLILHEYGEIIMKKGDVFSEKVLREKFLSKVDFYNEEHIVLDYHIALENIICEDWTEEEKTNSLVKTLIHNTVRNLNNFRNAFYKEYYQKQYGDYVEHDVLSKAKVTVAHKRKLQVGDKLSGRHGNKGVISKIVKEEDMPFLADGSSVDLVLTSLGVPSRMNLGQIYETLLGWAGEKLGCKYLTPVFAGFNLDSINEQMQEAGLPLFGETQLYDGLTGKKFDQTCTVGYIYFIKLNHMVDDKVHARSIGQYSMVSQQPLSGRAHFGGQRFGEMEVWALEAYGAANLLQEMLTIKSDDVKGRRKAYEAIIRGEELPGYGIPESFFVLVHELQGIGFDLIFE